MPDENFRRELNRVFDAVSGQTAPDLRERVRGAIGNAPETHGGSFWLAGVAGAVMAVLIVGVLVVAGPLKPSGFTPGGGVVQPSPSPSPSPVASPTASATVSPTAAPSATPPAVRSPQAVYSCAAQDFGVGRAGVVCLNTARGIRERSAHRHPRLT